MWVIIRVTQSSVIVTGCHTTLWLTFLESLRPFRRAERAYCVHTGKCWDFTRGDVWWQICMTECVIINDTIDFKLYKSIYSHVLIHKINRPPCVFVLQVHQWATRRVSTVRPVTSPPAARPPSRVSATGTARLWAWRRWGGARPRQTASVAARPRQQHWSAPSITLCATLVRTLSSTS